MSFKNVGERVGVYRLAERKLGPTAVETWMRRCRLWGGGCRRVAAGVGVDFPLSGRSRAIRPLRASALPAAQFRELLPGSEWGRYRQEGRGLGVFRVLHDARSAKESGEAYSYYGPCAFTDSRNCLPDIPSLAALATFGETHHWRAERFNGTLFERP